MKALLYLIMLCFCLSTQADELPAEIAQALATADMPASSLSLYIAPLNTGIANESDKTMPALLSYQAQIPRQTASTLKLLVSYAALSLLGADYQFATHAYRDGELVNHTLYGNVYLQGRGDALFNTDDFRHLLATLKQQGIRHIQGDLVLDQNWFATDHSTPEDGQTLRAYNAAPSALSINSQAINLQLSSDASSVKAHLEPTLQNLELINRLTLAAPDVSCTTWRKHLRYQRVANPDNTHITVLLDGEFPQHCVGKTLSLLLLDNTAYIAQLFSELWQAQGGTWHGVVHEGYVPAHAKWQTTHYGLPLAQSLVAMNKWSHNLMARQLLLALASTRYTPPLHTWQGSEVIHTWLGNLDFDFPELHIQNGAGLSHDERMSAEHLGLLLQHAYHSPIMPELLASLPILGVDGTLQNHLTNSWLRGQAHLKTGSLDGVSTLAGYVLNHKHTPYVLVMLLEHPHASASQIVQKAVLSWIYTHP